MGKRTAGEDVRYIKAEIVKTLKEIKAPLKEIVLFGSRAREDFRPDSDWDFLIVLSESLPIPEKRKIAQAVRKKLAEHYFPCDVIVKSEEELEYFRNFIGTVVREALKEGVTL